MFGFKRCKHEWVIWDVIGMADTAGKSNYMNIPHPLPDSTKKNVKVHACNLCGKIKKFEVTN